MGGYGVPYDVYTEAGEVVACGGLKSSHCLFFCGYAVTIQRSKGAKEHRPPEAASKEHSPPKAAKEHPPPKAAKEQRRRRRQATRAAQRNKTPPETAKLVHSNIERSNHHPSTRQHPSFSITSTHLRITSSWHHRSAVLWVSLMEQKIVFV